MFSIRSSRIVAISKSVFFPKVISWGLRKLLKLSLTTGIGSDGRPVGRTKLHSTTSSIRICLRVHHRTVLKGLNSYCPFVSLQAKVESSLHAKVTLKGNLSAILDQSWFEIDWSVDVIEFIGNLGGAMDALLVFDRNINWRAGEVTDDVNNILFIHFSYLFRSLDVSAFWISLSVEFVELETFQLHMWAV